MGADRLVLDNTEPLTDKILGPPHWQISAYVRLEMYL